MSYPNAAVIIIALSLMLVGSCTSESTKIILPTVGVKLDPPKSWRILANAEREERVRATDMKEKGLSDFIVDHMNKPFLVLSEDRINSPAPTVTFLIAPIEDDAATDPVRNLSRMAQSGFRAFDSYSIEVPTVKCVVGGKSAAYTKTTYRMPTEDGTLQPVTFESWYIVRDTNYILIGAVSGNPDTESVRSEIHDLVESIEFTK